MNFIKFSLLSLTLLLLYSCKRNSDIKNSNINTINGLFIKANNTNLKKQNRILYADSIFSILQTNKFDSITKVNYIKLHELYFSLNEEKKFFKVCKDLINKADNDKDFEASGNGIYRIANYYYNKVELDSAYFYFVKAEKKFNLLNKNRYLGYIDF